MGRESTSATSTSYLTSMKNSDALMEAIRAAYEPNHAEVLHADVTKRSSDLRKDCVTKELTPV